MSMLAGWEKATQSLDRYAVVDPSVVAYAKSRIPRLVSPYFDKRLGQLVMIGDHTRKKVRNALIEGYKNGENLSDMIERVRGAFNGAASVSRARTIARTETLIASSAGTADTWESLGVEKHEWLSMEDSHVRDSHQIDGQVRKVGDRFGNGCTYPGRHFADDPGEVINCRCDVLPVIEDSKQITALQDGKATGGPSLPPAASPPAAAPKAKKKPKSKPAKGKKKLPVPKAQPVSATSKPVGEALASLRPTNDRRRAAILAVKDANPAADVATLAKLEKAREDLFAEIRLESGVLHKLLKTAKANPAEIKAAREKLTALLAEADKSLEKIKLIKSGGGAAQARLVKQRALLRNELAPKAEDALPLQFGAGYKRESARGNVVEGRQFLASLLSRETGLTRKVAVKATSRNRAAASVEKASIEFSRKEALGTIVHEMAHHLEVQHESIRQRAIEFLLMRQRRSNGGNLGAPKQLSTLTGIKAYRKSEVAWEDDFGTSFVGIYPKPETGTYAGKVHKPPESYKTYTKREMPAGEIDFTEIVAMGAEALYRDPGKFAENDPEYFDFIVSLLRGEL